MLPILNIKENRSYFFVSLLVGLFILQKLINTTDRKFIIVFLVSISLILYNVWQKNMSVQKSSKKNEDFIIKAVEYAKKDDDLMGNLSNNYVLAKKLIQSDRSLWMTLQKFKKIARFQNKTYEYIIVKIVRFFDIYARLLKGRKMRYSGIDELIEKRQDILNTIQEFNLQSVTEYDIGNYVKKLSLSVLMSLNRCIRVLKNKYKSKNLNTSPLAFNMMDDPYKLF